MALRSVTVSGIDESVDPVDLLGLSGDYPFVEWGMLVSSRHTHPTVGMPRFPSTDWMARFIADAHYHPLRIAVHVCGRWVEEILAGEGRMLHQLLPVVGRVQLNFAGRQLVPYSACCFLQFLEGCPEGQLIFQIGGQLGAQAWVDATEGTQRVTCMPLFDDSHGTGHTPARWTASDVLTPVPRLLGYAGGLGPETLTDELPRILDAAGHASCWIDMETRVRSDDLRRCDLAKVRRCLEIAAPYIASEVDGLP